MKAIYSSDDDGASNDDSGIAVEGAGPITEWWITGEKPLVMTTIIVISSSHAVESSGDCKMLQSELIFT